MPRRTRIEILIDLLEAVARHPGEPATRLAMYSNMPYDRFSRLAAMLEEKGILTKMDNEGKTGYALTEKGRALLKELRRLRRVLSDFGLEAL